MFSSFFGIASFLLGGFCIGRIFWELWRGASDYIDILYRGWEFMGLNSGLECFMFNGFDINRIYILGQTQELWVYIFFFFFFYYLKPYQDCIVFRAFQLKPF